jgi:membrane protein CcdC involved in cytochrome C biogenesis
MPFDHLSPPLTLAATLIGAAAVIAWRLRETSTPVSTPKIVAPPLGMSTGLAMFLAPAARVPWLWAATAFLLGAVVFSIPVARTSRLVRRGDVVLMQRSKAFLAILLGLVALRFALRSYVEHLVSPAQTAGLMFLLAFGMILRWRVGMLIAYRRLRPPTPDRSAVLRAPLEAGPLRGPALGVGVSGGMEPVRPEGGEA